jgi:hypothetical protein
MDEKCGVVGGNYNAVGSFGCGSRGRLKTPFFIRFRMLLEHGGYQYRIIGDAQSQDFRLTHIGFAERWPVRDSSGSVIENGDGARPSEPRHLIGRENAHYQHK